MVLTNTPISVHDHGARRALQPRVAPMPYFTCQNWILALVVICDQTGALVIGTAHEHFIHQRLLVRILIPSLGAPSTCDEFYRPLTSLEAPHYLQTRSTGGTYWYTHIPASAHGLFQRSLRSRFADHSLRLPTLQALRNCID